LTHLSKIQSRIFFLFFFYVFSNFAHGQTAQTGTFTREDSLRGHLNEFRTCFDVKHYDLKVNIDVSARTISGKNRILMVATRSLKKFQLDMFRNMSIDSVLYDGDKLEFDRDADAFYVRFQEPVAKDDTFSVSVFYHGKPFFSLNPPWSGGFIWEKDTLGRDWIAVACEGAGASLWWPNKDHLSDEPDSMQISIIAPDSLVAISNGLLKKVTVLMGSKKEWTWEVTYPINNYNVTLNLAHYGYFQEIYRNSASDLLPLDYYVLDYNLDKARTHFGQVKEMLACFEHYLGEFPFWNDGYALVETPYWGMEHQSCIAYGNEYENNDYGFDFIIVHESAHEYWGNSITVKDHAELWIHESFATYMEVLYVEYFLGRSRAQQYLNDQRKMIYNVKPVLGPLEVNYNDWDDADMYNKGSWMLHSIRNTLNDDSLWFRMLKATYQEFKFKNITSSDIINFMDAMTPSNLKPIFLHFLTTTEIPTLKVKKSVSKKGLELVYQWENVENDFDMPVVLQINNEQDLTLNPTTKRQKILLPVDQSDQVQFDTDRFYYQVEE
jgi:aminopeptidase N